MHPPDVPPYKHTATFTQDSLPAGIRSAHRTKAGVWGRLVVEEGACELVFEDDGRRVRCAPGAPGEIPPQAPHHVEVVGAVRLFVEFRRAE